MNKKRILAMTTAALMGVSMMACGSQAGSTGAATDAGSTDTATASTSSVANKDKPLVWYNRQPSNSSTGELDSAALSFNKDTYYVGFDAVQGAELQGQMIADYIEAHKDTLDRNGDGIVGYVLAIGDIGHNDSIARTRGVRKALGTGVEKDGAIVSDPAGTNTDGSSTVVQDGTVAGLTVRELASQEMKNSAGATWDAATAGNAIGTWTSSFGDQIDIVVSNNDGMGMSMFNAWSKAEGVPTFGYDANSDAVAAIADGYSGTISQHADVQAYLTLRVLRNALVLSRDTKEMEISSSIKWLYTFHEGRIEAAEFQIDKAFKNCGKQLMDPSFKLRNNVLIATISRDNEVMLATGSSTIENGDRIIVVSADKHLVDAVEILA